MARLADDGMLEPIDAALRAMLDTAQRERDAVERRQRYWRERQAHESATFAGAAHRIADDTGHCQVRSLGGEHAGGLAEVGRDFLRIACHHGAGCIVALHAVQWIRSAGPGVLRPDQVLAGVERELTDALRDLVLGRPQVHAVSVDGSQVTGTVRAVGSDVLVMQAADGSALHLAVRAVADVRLAPLAAPQSSDSPLSPAPTTSG